MEMNGKKYEVNQRSYSIKIRDKKSVNRLAEKINPTKDQIEPEKYSEYHNANQHREKSAKYTEILGIENKGNKKVYNIEVENNHNYLTSSREILHNCGRAGRPKYDDRGEAISVAKNPGSVDEIRDRYVLGEPERIQSKLNVEPVLRMHTLALVASNFCNSMNQLLEFYQKTFYAHQFGDMGKVAEKIRDVVESLRAYSFIKEDELKATKIGKKVSDLYIDPDSAHYMLESLEAAEGTETRPISYLFMIAMTSEMAPRLRVKDKEWSDYQNALQDAELYLLEDLPNEWETGYEKYLESMKTAMMMQSWIQEMDEERIMNEFGTAPGGIRSKMQNADWLLYGGKELLRMKDSDYSETEKDIEKLRVRMKHGIKEELLDLVNYDQIGRVRARKLHDHGIETQSQIREVNFEKLKKLIGKKTAKKLKKQVGQENIFDREDITDWYD
jgi:helicase